MNSKIVKDKELLNKFEKMDILATSSIDNPDGIFLKRSLNKFKHEGKTYGVAPVFDNSFSSRMCLIELN
ncbi:MAG: hypothetical protein EBU90_01485 [Proteobacteria bacterium]|nr:hypothetical protein [Pseudomonadota bacterium]